jgi:hypothetical protein
MCCASSGIAVGDPDVAHPRVGGLPREERARLPRSQDQQRVTREVAEHLGREVEADRRDRQRVSRDLRLGPHALARRERALEEAVEDGARRPGLARDAQGAADLPEHLALAESHRLEPGGHAEKMARGVGALPREARPRRFGEVQPPPFRDQTRQLLVAAVPRRYAVNLAPVARRDDDALGHQAAPTDPLQRLADLLRRERDALAHGDRRGTEVPAEKEEAGFAGRRHRKLCACVK